MESPWGGKEKQNIILYKNKTEQKRKQNTINLV